jgi:hypothetical protein
MRQLTEQYRAKDREMQEYQRKHNIQLRSDGGSSPAAESGSGGGSGGARGKAGGAGVLA